MELGLLSSRYPFLSSAHSRGILILQPLLATPAEKSWIEEVSLAPASLLSLSCTAKELDIKVSRSLAHLALVRIVSLDMPDVMPGQLVNGSLQ